VTSSQTFLQSFRIVIYPQVPPNLSKSSSRSICTIIGFQISSFAQIVNLGLAVFPEHIIPNLEPLHLVPDSSSFTLDYQVWSHEPTELPEKFEHFGNFGFGMLEIVNSMQCNRLESSYLVNLSFRRTCSTCWTSLRMCNLWKLEFFRWWARHAALRMVSVILVAATSRHHRQTRQ
jgi:hypothetical protein